ncbi:alkaline phosphatase D family protein [Hydrogenophaga sp.]|uniref:alkaline phosphatase D family protein n=1 Tax=Hydrogenophaga sp. TaxID=1904254 RepID=UPI0039FD0F05
MTVLVGNGLGGGSLINAGVAVLPEPTLLQNPHWPTHYRHHAAHRDALWQAMQEVQSVLQARPFAQASELRKYQALSALGQSLGEVAEAVPITVASEDQISTAGVAQAACTRCGNCFTGCNVGAKNTLLTHVLPDAVRAGAELITGLTVLDIRPCEGMDAKADDGGPPYLWLVRMAMTADLSSTGERQVMEVRARSVVLSAGALGSTEILQRSSALKLSPCLGQRFSTNGDVLALGWGMGVRVNGMARADEAEQAPNERVGPTITGRLAPSLQVDGQQRRVLVEDGAVPSALTQAVVALGATLSLPHRYTRSGLQDYHASRKAAGESIDPLSTPPDIDRHALLMLVMGPDDADGRIRFKPGQPDAHGAARRDALDITWSGPKSGPRSAYYQAVHDWLIKASERGGFQGGDYLPSPLWKPLPDDFEGVAAGVDNPLGLTVHPLGGCPMGDGPDNGAVNWQGTVFRADGGQGNPLYEGLHVLDGGMLPTAVGVNPFVTIAGLSLVAARAMRQQLDAQDAARARPAPVVPLPVEPLLEPAPVAQARVGRPPAAVEQPVRLQFREHLQGHWQAERPHWAPAANPQWTDDERLREWVVAVDVDLNLDQWLGNPSMRLEGARMRIFHNPTPHDLTIRPELTQGQPWLEGAGWVSLLASDPADGPTGVVRRLAALATFAARRPLSDFQSTKSKKNLFQKIQALWRAAGNHAQYRTLNYAFELQAATAGVPPVQAAGQKRLAYAPFQKTPWEALVSIDLHLTPGSGHPPAVLALNVDLIDMVRRQRLQVASAPDTPAAIIGLASFGSLWLRALFQTHFWSLRGQDYDRLQTGAPAKHGPLYPTLPGPACQPEVTKLPVPRYAPFAQAGGASAETLSLELTRYTPAQGSDPARHLLMIHGLAHGATVFSTDTTGGRNMAAAFLAQGYTVWLLDHRLSNRLGYAKQQHSMDDLAQLDIPAAVAHVYRTAGQPIRVLAHCVGGGAFAMATLRGWLQESPGQSRVKAAIIHAVHPWVVPSVSNQLSGELAALYRDWLPADLAIDPVPPRKPAAIDQLIDRLAASLPWPQAEQAAHLAHVVDPEGGTATCNRMTLFYGREWVHANLADATHRQLATLVGPASVEVFRQLYYIITRQRLTDREGAGVYMTRANFQAHWSFPVLFAHGTQNRVFDPRSAVRSWLQLSRLQSEQPQPAQRQVGLFMPEGYGHMDFLFGKDAHRDVYPSLVRFMDDPARFDSTWSVSSAEAEASHQRIPRHWQDHSASVQRQPLTGPMLQLNRLPSADGQTDPWGVQGQRELVVWVELPNDPWLAAHPPRLVCADESGADDLPGLQVTQLQAIHPTGGADAQVQPRPAVASRATLLEGAGSYWVLRLRETEKLPFARLPALELVWGWPQAAVPLNLSRLPWWHRWHSGHMLLNASGSAQPSISWLASSCRWPGLPFERNAVDGLALHMQEHIHHPARPVQALVLLGDQIYADATANLFDVQEGDERLAQFYRDAWGGPHTRALLARLPTYTVVDDHEYVDNWNGSTSPETDPTFLNGFEATLAYQWRWNDGHDHAPRIHPAIPAGGDAVRGFWRPFHIGHLPAFAMDTRSERHPQRPGQHWSTVPMLSQAQMKAVENWLLAHRDQPKVLCMGTVFGWVESALAVAPERCIASDGWAGYPASWRWLVQFIVHSQISHTIFLAGDYHFSGVAELSLSADGGAPVRALSVVCSGWNASLPFANATPHNFVLDATTPYPFSDAQAAIQSNARGLGTEQRQFSKLTVRLAGAGLDRWALDVEVFSESEQPTARWVAAL